MIQVAIVDDHDVVRDSLSMLIEMHDRMEVSFTADSYDSLIEQLEISSIDLLILDLNLGNENGFLHLQQLIASHPTLPVLIMSGYPEDPYGNKVLQYGASGYLNKGDVADKIIDAIEVVLRGECYFNTLRSSELSYD